MFVCRFFFFNDTATTEIYTLSLHDALPILDAGASVPGSDADAAVKGGVAGGRCAGRDRKSKRLNSSHSQISYAVFCLKKKKFTYHTAPLDHFRPASTNCSTSSSTQSPDQTA